MKPTWQTDDGQVQLYLGDCLAVLPTLEAGSVDAVVTDPPYFLPALHYSTRKNFPRSLSDLGILEYYFRSVFDEFARATALHAVWYIFCDGQSYPAFYATCYPHARRLVPLIWDKETSINGYSWRHQHELILFCERDESPAVPTGDGDVLRLRAVPVDDRKHPAEKPVALLERLVKKSTTSTQLVLDPFMGSAATGAACMRLERPFIGIEKDPGYFEIAVKRIQAELARHPLFDQSA